MFIPGETISHQFNLPFNSNGIKDVTISYRQNGRIILVKTVNQIINTEYGSQVTLVLSQDESLLFDNDSEFYVQLNVLFTSGTRAASREMRGYNLTQQIREVVT